MTVRTRSVSVAIRRAGHLTGAFKSSRDSVGPSDENIVAMLALLNGESILMARLADERTNDPTVRRLTRTLIADHSAQRAAVDSVAKAANLTPLPPAAAIAVQSASGT